MKLGGSVLHIVFFRIEELALSASMTDEDDTTILPSHLECHNVLGIAEANCMLDLGRVVRGFKNAEYDASKFNCVRIRLWRHKCTVAVFGSGKLQVTGASDVGKAKLALKQTAFRLKKKLGFSNLVFSNLKIDNILLTFDMGAKMDLNGIAKDPAITCTYLPSQFAAAVVREVGTGIVIDVFASGKMNIKGRESMERICQGVNLLMPKISKHICQDLDYL